MNPASKMLIAVACIAATALPVPASAQAIYFGHVRNELIDAGTPLGPRNGIAIGLSQPVFGIGPVDLLFEPFYVQKGAKPQVLGEDGIDDLRVDYIELNLLGRYASPVALGPVRPWVVAGGAFGWMSKCSFGFEEGGDRSASCPFAGLQQMGLESPIDDYDWSVAYGGGLDVRVPYVGGLRLGVRFTRSLGKVIIGTTDSEPKHTTRIITLGVAIPS